MKLYGPKRCGDEGRKQANARVSNKKRKCKKKILYFGKVGDQKPADRDKRENRRVREPSYMR